MATYYIAAAGSDSNSGLSPSLPWQTITKVNAASPSPGDSFLFNGGDTFSGTIACSTSGTLAAPITFGSYGAGKAIISCGNQRAVYVQNASGIVLQNLIASGVGVNSNGSMSDSSTFFLYAFDFQSTLTNGSLNQGITVLSCQATGVAGGVFVHCDAATTPVGFTGITIGGTDSDPFLCHEALLMGVYIQGSLAYQSSGSPYFLPLGYQHTNVNIHQCVCHHIYAIPSAVYSTVNFSGSGIVVSNSTSVTIDKCLVYTCGAKNDDSRGGPVGIMTLESLNSVITHCEVHDQGTSNGDGTGIDVDGGSQNTQVKWCYCHDNKGSPYATGYYVGSDPTDTVLFAYNIGVMNQSGCDSSVHRWSQASTNVVINENTFYVDESGATSGSVAVLYVETNDVVKNNIFITTGSRPFVIIYGTGQVLQGNLYWSVANTPLWEYNGGSSFSTLSGFRGSSASPEMLGGNPVGQYGNPLLPGLGLGGNINNVGTMNVALTAYDPPTGSLANSNGVTGGTAAPDFHNQLLAGGAATPVGAVIFNVAPSVFIFRPGMSL